MRRALFLLLLVILLAGAFVLGFELSGSRAPAPAATPSVVQVVRDELSARYYRPVPGRVLQLGSVRSMLAALNDPYTQYLDRSAFQLLRRETAGSYTGIGIELLPVPGGLLVVALQPGPAKRAGVHVGDTIVEIDGRSAARLGPAGALARITGRRGTTIRLGALRSGRRLAFAVTRAAVEAPTVPQRVLSFGGRRFGYVRVPVFRSGAAGTVAAQVRRLRREHVQGLVLDLRENPGGLLDEAVATASVFLSKGLVVTLEGAHRPREAYDASGHPVEPRLPLAVLVDRYSASSAEIVAAALQDHKRATLVGSSTFGKAVVQSIDPLANGGALALTTARYFTPRGADISRRGVSPDVRVVDDPRTPIDDVLATALATLAARTS